MSLRSSQLLPFAAGAASFGVLSLLYSSLRSQSLKSKIIQSPLARLDLSTSDTLSYPPSGFLPGARDVDSPFGSFRVYEFGPLDATRKVLLVHGISTPSLALAGIAECLVERGCRVMLLDLFGRGWSDMPADLIADERLYTTQIFMALASSSIPWTGTADGGRGFTIFGYSMGGGIAANFTSYFPELIEDLVLLAPAGLIRDGHRDWVTKLLYSGRLPEKFVAGVVSRRLMSNPNVKTTPTPESPSEDADGVAGDVASAEVANITELPRAFGRSIDPQAAVKWQIEEHPGFAKSFVSSIRFAPVAYQHDRWRLIGRRLVAQRDAQKSSAVDSDVAERAVRRGLGAGKVLMVLGRTDTAVFSPELEVDARAVLGAGNLEVLTLEAGHEVPITHSREIVDFVWQQWERSP